MSEPVIQQFYQQKKFKPGELKNALLSVAATFKPAKAEDVKVVISYSRAQDRELNILEDPSLRELHEITVLKDAPYGILLYLEPIEIFFGCIKKSLQLCIRKCDMVSAVMIQKVFEVTADLNPKANTCYYCGEPNVRGTVVKTLRKNLGSQLSGGYVTRQYLQKKMTIPRCPRCARLVVLFNSLIIALFIAGFGVWLYLLLGQGGSATTLILVALLFGFPLLYAGVTIGLLLLIARLIRFNIKTLRSYPAFQEEAAEGWSF